MSDEAASNTMSPHESDDIVSSSPASIPSSNPGASVAPNQLGGHEVEEFPESFDETLSHLARSESLWDLDQARDPEFHDSLAVISRAGREILPKLEKVATELDANPNQSQPEREALEREFHTLNLRVLQLSEQSRLRQLQKIAELQHRNAEEESAFSTALESVEEEIRALTARRENIKLVQQKYVEMNAEIGRWEQEMLADASTIERSSSGI